MPDGLLTSTKSDEYAQRLSGLQKKGWKENLRFLDPYRWHLRQVCTGRVLDIGCGIGRVLGFIQTSTKQAVGVDHNISSVQMCKTLGYEAYVPVDFHSRFRRAEYFDTFLLSHVLEHMTVKDGIKAISEYLPLLKQGGKVVIIVPQEKGYASDASHVEFMTSEKLHEIGAALGLSLEQDYSFPFPRFMGPIYIYNETVYIGAKS